MIQKRPMGGVNSFVKSKSYLSYNLLKISIFVLWITISIPTLAFSYYEYTANIANSAKEALPALKKEKNSVAMRELKKLCEDTDRAVTVLQKSNCSQLSKKELLDVIENNIEFILTRAEEVKIHPIIEQYISVIENVNYMEICEKLQEVYPNDPSCIMPEYCEGTISELSGPITSCINTKTNKQMIGFNCKEWFTVSTEKKSKNTPQTAIYIKLSNNIITKAKEMDKLPPSYIGQIPQDEVCVQNQPTVKKYMVLDPGIDFLYQLVEEKNGGANKNIAAWFDYCVHNELDLEDKYQELLKNCK